MSTWKPSGTPRSQQEPKPVAASLDRVTKRLGGPGADVMVAVFSHWAEIVGPSVAAHASPVSIRGGVLVIAVDQPAWAAQLRYLGADLLTRVRDATGSDQVSEIQIRVSGEPHSARGRKSGR